MLSSRSLARLGDANADGVLVLSQIRIISVNERVSAKDFYVGSKIEIPFISHSCHDTIYCVKQKDKIAVG